MSEKVSKRAKKMMEKATHLVFNALSNFFFVLANLKDINGYNMMKKIGSITKLRLIFPTC